MVIESEVIILLFKIPSLDEQMVFSFYHILLFWRKINEDDDQLKSWRKWAKFGHILVWKKVLSAWLQFEEMVIKHMVTFKF